MITKEIRVAAHSANDTLDFNTSAFDRALREYLWWQDAEDHYKKNLRECKDSEMVSYYRNYIVTSTREVKRSKAKVMLQGCYLARIKRACNMEPTL